MTLAGCMRLRRVEGNLRRGQQLVLMKETRQRHSSESRCRLPKKVAALQKMSPGCRKLRMHSHALDQGRNRNSLLFSKARQTVCIP